ncbi:MAG: M28 family peptidase [Bacillota bacterium]|nr:M28 family peptidase [Bacillota bacterium]
MAKRQAYTFILIVFIAIILLCTCAAPDPLQKQSPPQPEQSRFSASEVLDEEKLMEHIGKLCSLERKAGTTEEKEAADYIAGQFTSSGYTVNVARFSFSTEHAQKLPDTYSLIMLDDTEFDPSLYPVKYCGNGSAEGELRLFEDKETECKGCVALIPVRDDTWELAQTAKGKGACGLLFYAPSEDVCEDGVPWECLEQELGLPAAGAGFDDGEKLIRKAKKGEKARLVIEGARWKLFSQNVSAIKKALVADPEIIIIGAHYDSFAGLPGANDDASGVSVLLELARIIRSVPSDTEIRFIAFGAEEEGQLGAKDYIKGLDENTKSRVVGMIQLDRLGSEQLSVCYAGQNACLIGEMLRSGLRKNQSSATERQDDQGSHTVFCEAGMDAVMLCGNGSEQEYRNARDTQGNIKKSGLAAGGNAVLSVVLQAADLSSGRLNGSAATQAARKITLPMPVSTMETHSVLWFGEKRSDVEELLSLNGLPYIKEGEMTAYEYMLKWLDMDRAVKSIFWYDESNRLYEVEIMMQDAGYSYDETYDILKACFGEPDEAAEGEDGTEKCWYTIYRKMFALQQEGDAYFLYVYEYGVEDKVFRQFNVHDEHIRFGKKDEKYEQIWKMISSMMRPEDIKKIARFTVFTDGVSGKLAQVEFIGQNQYEYGLSIDYWDVFDENGNIRDKKEIFKTLVHEYAHILTLGSDQVDLDAWEERDVFADIGCFKDGSYLQGFYSQFYKPLEEDARALDFDEFYSKYIDSYPSEYAATCPSEDLAECFAAFVTDAKASGELAKKMTFLSSFSKLVQAKGYILSHLPEVLGEGLRPPSQPPPSCPACTSCGQRGASFSSRNCFVLTFDVHAAKCHRVNEPVRVEGRVTAFD